MGKELATHKHSLLAILAGCLDAQGWLQGWALLPVTLGPHVHPLNHRLPSEQWLYFIRLCLPHHLPNSHLRFFNLGSSQWWHNRVAYYAIPAPPETRSWLLRCPLAEIRSTVSVVFLQSRNLTIKGIEGTSACLVISEPKLAPFLNVNCSSV